MGAGVTDRDINGRIPPIIGVDGIVEPGVRRGERVPDHASATDRATGSEPLPVARHSSMSLLQAPNSTPVDGGADGAADNGIVAGMLPVVSGDGIGKPGARGGKTVPDLPIATDRETDSEPFSVDRQSSISLLQAPNSTPVDGGAGVIEAGILPVVSGNGAVKPGVRADRSIRDRASANDREAGTGLPVGCHNNMSLFQAPNCSPVDGGASAVGN
jgi:hypothetical protein